MPEEKPRQEAPASGKTPLPRRVVVAEVFLLAGAVLAAAAAPLVGAGVGPLRLDHPVILTALLLYLPFIPYAQRRVELQDLGLGPRDFSKSLLLTLKAAFFAFPPFVLFWYVAGGARLGIPPPRPLEVPFPFDPAEWAGVVATQFLSVAIPEEWFFRGYLQHRLVGLFPRRIGWRSLSLPAGAILGSFLFALAHALRYDTALRLNVFFPSLLFAWARDRGGHLAGPVLLHAGANLLMRALSAP